MKTYSITYAQNREDLIAFGFLKKIKNGFYVDVGANDPDMFSVTKRFYMSGWHGINIEPSETFYRKLVSARHRDINLNIGVGHKSEKKLFREYKDGDGLSTFSESIKKEYQRDDIRETRNYTDKVIRIRTLQSIFEEFSVTHIDFLKIDVEGYEYEVIMGNDWATCRPTLLCIEANHIQKDWRKVLLGNGYALAFFDGLNEYYLADESIDLCEGFSYADSVLDRKYITFEQSKILDHLRDRILGLEKKRAIDYQEYVKAVERIQTLERALNNNTQHEVLRPSSSMRFFNMVLIKRAKSMQERYLPIIIDFGKEFLARVVIKHNSHVKYFVLHNKVDLLKSVHEYDFLAGISDENKKI